jgi:hypothetical protein
MIFKGEHMRKETTFYIPLEEHGEELAITRAKKDNRKVLFSSGSLRFVADIETVEKALVALKEAYLGVASVSDLPKTEGKSIEEQMLQEDSDALEL